MARSTYVVFPFDPVHGRSNGFDSDVVTLMLLESHTVGQNDKTLKYSFHKTPKECAFTYSFPKMFSTSH